jgi:hypothetical protein
MGTMIRSDGFRLTLSGVSVLALVSGLVFIVRLDAKADAALSKFDAIGLQVEALRQDMKADRTIINDHSVELREHRTIIHELQRRAVGKEW